MKEFMMAALPRICIGLSVVFAWVYFGTEGVCTMGCSWVPHRET